MRVTRLRVYPVKSCAGEDVDAAWANPWGLDQDRRWGLVGRKGEKLTAREHKQLLGLSARSLGENAVRLADRDGGVIDVDMREGGDVIAVDHSRQGSAVAAGSDVNRWLSDRLGFRVRLVWQPDPMLRPIAAEDGGQAGDVMSLADGAPLLLITESSMRQLDDWAGSGASPVDPVRFRPNVIIDGGEPFVEEGWTGVNINGVGFRVTMICDRCSMTTVDPATLARGREPIRTLAAHRRRENKTWFGLRLTPLGQGRIHVGDPVEPFSA
ncbi:MAG: MOSC N-terminal beta barrel domain-containing protein [Arachnia sp.]